MRDVGVSSRHHHGARWPGSTELLPILIRVSAAPAVHSGVVLTFYICLCNFHRAPGHADALSAISISWDAERRTKQPEIPLIFFIKKFMLLGRLFCILKQALLR